MRLLTNIPCGCGTQSILTVAYMVSKKLLSEYAQRKPEASNVFHPVWVKVRGQTWIRQARPTMARDPAASRFLFRTSRRDGRLPRPGGETAAPASFVFSSGSRLPRFAKRWTGKAPLEKSVRTGRGQFSI